MKESPQTETEQVAGNGLLHRRMFLAGGAAAMGAGVMVDQAVAAPLAVEPWMKIPGAPFNGYGQPSKYEEKVARTWASAPGTGGTGSCSARSRYSNGSGDTSVGSLNGGCPVRMVHSVEPRPYTSERASCG